MKKNEPTPGPWHLEWTNLDNGPAFRHESASPMNEESADADCVLMEAAPLLLAICKRIQERGLLLASEQRELYLQLESALEKAEGK